MMTIKLRHMGNFKRYMKDEGTLIYFIELDYLVFTNLTKTSRLARN